MRKNSDVTPMVSTRVAAIFNNVSKSVMLKQSQAAMKTPEVIQDQLTSMNGDILTTLGRLRQQLSVKQRYFFNGT